MKLKHTNINFKPASWPAKTYRARRGDWTFTVAHNGTCWILNSWHRSQPATFPGKPAYAAPNYTAAQLMRLVDDFAATIQGD